MRYRRSLDALFAAIVLALLGSLGTLSACSSGESLEGTWVFDTDRLGEFDVVASAVELERAEIIANLKKEAEALTLVITKDTMKLTVSGQTQEAPYRVVSTEGKKWTIESDRGGIKSQSVLELDGNSLVIRNAEGRVMQVYRRK